MIPLLGSTYNSQIHWDRKENGVRGAEQSRNGELGFNEDCVLVLQDEIV